MQDSEIIELYFARDELAIAVTERQYGRYCQAVAMNVLDSQPDAEECVNDTWLRAWNAIPPARPDPLRVWLGRITRNLAISRYRAANRQKRAHVEVALDELEGCLAAVPEECGDELRELLDEFLATLPTDERRLFVGRYWYAYTPKILSRAYGMTQNAVNLRVMRTREKLKAFLAERGYTV